MTLLQRLRTMDKRLRLTLGSTALLLVPVIGQAVAVSDINRTGREGDLAVLFMVAAIFIVPMVLILAVAMLAGLRRHLHGHAFVIVLNTINILVSVNIAVFFFQQCGWAHVVGLTLRGCS